MIPSLAKDTVEIPCTLKHETEKAILISAFDTEGELVKVWIPFSQVQSLHRSVDGMGDSITVSTWIARTKELIE